MACQKDHSKVSHIMSGIPDDQGGAGRHKCAACAYEIGFMKGKALDGACNIDQVLNELEESQAGAQRHKSPHAAFAKGYSDGVAAYYRERGF